MIGIQTQTGIRLQAVSFQMQVVNERTVKSDILNEIIDYCIREQTLEKIIINGVRGSEVHAKLIVSIDYNVHGQQIRINGDSIDGSSSYRDGGCVGPSNPRNQGENLTDCPVWRQAIDWFTRLTKEQKLVLEWSVNFRAKNDEMMSKFGLVYTTHTDMTKQSPLHNIPHSFLPELTAVTSFSKELWPES